MANGQAMQLLIQPAIQPAIRRVCSRTGIIAGLISLGSVCAGAQGGSLDNARELAARVRAQPTQSLSQSEPGWLVERADNSSMKVSVLSQTRYTMSERDSGFINPGDEVTYGFSQPRTRLSIEGALVSSQLNYRVSMDFGDAEIASPKSIETR